MKLLFIPLLLIATIGFTNPIVVSQKGPASYKSIQQAVDAAEANTLIFVLKGHYTENVILRDGISLQGFDDPVIDGNNTGAVVTMSSFSFISGFTIINSGSERGITDAGVYAKDVKQCIIHRNNIIQNGHYGIIVDNSDCLIHYNNISENKILGIYVTGRSLVDIGGNTINKNPILGIDIVSVDVLSGAIYNNVIAETKTAITDDDRSYLPQPLRVYNNIFYHCGKALSITRRFAFQIEHNCFYGNDINYFDLDDWTPFYAGESDVFNDPLFVDAPNGNFSLQPSSPCLGAGFKGLHIGLFGPGQNTEDATKSVEWNSLNAKYILYFTANAINNTNAAIEAAFSGVIYSDDGINFTLLGQYDNINLFGSVQMTGKLIEKSSDTQLSVFFDEGFVRLGNDGSGYPDGLNLQHKAIVTVSRRNLNVTFNIDARRPYLTQHQKGFIVSGRITPNRPFKELLQNFNQ